MTARSGELTLEIKRVLPAGPSVVFGAFSAPDELAKWRGPEGFSAASLEFNPRMGDSYRIEMQPPEGDYPVPNGCKPKDCSLREAVIAFQRQRPASDDPAAPR